MSIHERREIELKNREKTTHKMSRDGLVEENLSKGTAQNISQREQDAVLQQSKSDPARHTAEPARSHKPKPQAGRQGADATGAEPAAHNSRGNFRLEHENTGAPGSSERKSQQHRKPRPDFEPETAEAEPPPSEPGDGSPVVYERQSKLEHAEDRLAKTEKKLDKAKKKQPKKKKLKTKLVFDEEAGKAKRKLYVEETPKPTGKGSLPKRGLKKAGSTASLQMHRKMYQVEHENVGTKAAHRTELTGEAALRGAARHRRTSAQKLQKKTVKLEKKAAKAQGKLAFEKALKTNPELAKKSTVQKQLYKRQLQKKHIKKAKKATKQAKKAAKKSTKLTHRAVSFVKRHPGAAAVGIAAGVIGILAGSIFSTIGGVFGQAGLTMVSGTYVAEDDELNQAELYYTEMETDLYLQAYGLEAQNPGYDEYRYNIGELSHNPYELMAYLNAAYNEFTFAEIQPVLESVFAQQYRLWTEEVIETRTREVEKTDPETGLTYTETEEYEYRIFCINISSSMLTGVLSGLMDSDQASMYETYMTTRGNRFYFSPPFDFNWTFGLTSGYGWRIHPISGEKDMHKAVDISAPHGTPIKAVQHGTVTTAGSHSSYGNYVVIEDSEGLKSLYAHCSSLSVSTGQTVTRGDEIGKVGSTGESTGDHLHLEVYRDGVSLNPAYFVDPGNGEWPGGAGGYPGEPYDDETFARIMAEATKYIGWPYVFGGSTPATSFDCSGFVSWVYTQSGVYNIGRDTAQGIYNRCSPVSASEARPGDLVFFHSTYSTTSYVTHIGIYVGNNQMLHCGNPIGYADLGISYWQQHLIGFGRLV